MPWKPIGLWDVEAPTFSIQVRVTVATSDKLIAEFGDSSDPRGNELLL
jgi:hypothetical protein